ncbi:zf-HC2 domain-containing protein [Saccharopolyspora spinosa]|uniref:zf-HC2 domain-containing protein n=1 Tax=Saccharopolyspora spinosa TaxID=60894 RepID=UPI0002379F58|nr:zf-HC2 domain-containing protein [Saccharopolyspora spinosa]
MDCQRCREALSALADGQAAPGEEAAAGRHLASCPACRVAAEGMAAVTRWLRVRPAVPSRDFVPGLLAVFDAQVAGRSLVGASVVALWEQPRPDDGQHCTARRPCCVPDHVVVWGVGTASCGCAAGCGCGCQDGAPCQCHASVA